MQKDTKHTDKKFPKEKKSFKPKKRGTDERNDKSSFQRYRDDSRPSDYGTNGRRNEKEKSFHKKDVPEKSSFKKKYVKSEEKPAFKKIADDKKPFQKKTNEFKKNKPTRNPFDIDDSDLNYGKEKTYSGNKDSKYRTAKPFNKKGFSKRKGESKPQRETDDGTIRLNKYISNAGICSRREADSLIASGVVQVNGKIITEMGFRVNPTDIVKFGDQTLKKEKMVYLILNKPKDYITTIDDPEKRRTVLELVHGACRERIYPVGRLDRNTTGLLMFTNDGELTKKLTHPRYGVKKVYHVEIDKPLKHQDLKAISEGIELEDGEVKVDEIAYVGNGTDKTQVGVEIHSGKNRVVRRIFEHFGYNVRKLDRVMFGPLTKKDLARGRWRFLTQAEVGMLQMIPSK